MAKCKAEGQKGRWEMDYCKNNMEYYTIRIPKPRSLVRKYRIKAMGLLMCVLGIVVILVLPEDGGNGFIPVVLGIAILFAR